MTKRAMLLSVKKNSEQLLLNCWKTNEKFLAGVIEEQMLEKWQKDWDTSTKDLWTRKKTSDFY